MEWGLDFFDEEDEKWFEGIKDVFEKYDKDGNGTLDMDELGHAIRCVCPHMRLTDDDVHKIFIRMDLDGDRSISCEEFFLELEEAWDEEIPDETPEELFQSAIQKHINQMNKKLAEYEDIITIFQEFDIDGNGSIDHNEFARATMKLGMDMDEDDIDLAFNMIDASGDQRIDSMEFVFMCCAISLRYPALQHIGPLEVFTKCVLMLKDVAEGTFEPRGDWEPKPRMTRKMAITIPDEAPGDISDNEFQDDGVPVTLVCDDASNQVELTKTEARLAVMVQSKMKEGIRADEGVWFDAISAKALDLVCRYLRRKEGKRPHPIQKPLFSREMRKLCTDPWDAVFIDGLTKAEVYEFIHGCYCCGVRSGINLGCCKIATLKPSAMGTDPDSIRKWISMDEDSLLTKADREPAPVEQTDSDQLDQYAPKLQRFQRQSSQHVNPFAGRAPPLSRNTGTNVKAIAEKSGVSDYR